MLINMVTGIFFFFFGQLGRLSFPSLPHGTGIRNVMNACKQHIPLPFTSGGSDSVLG